MSKSIHLLNKFAVYCVIGDEDSEIICTVHWVLEKTDAETNKLQCYNGMVIFLSVGIATFSIFCSFFPECSLPSHLIFALLTPHHLSSQLKDPLL